jgi:hypothetical protein
MTSSGRPHFRSQDIETWSAGPTMSLPEGSHVRFMDRSRSVTGTGSAGLIRLGDAADDGEATT